MYSAGSCCRSAPGAAARAAAGCRTRRQTVCWRRSNRHGSRHHRAPRRSCRSTATASMRCCCPTPWNSRQTRTPSCARRTACWSARASCSCSASGRGACGACARAASRTGFPPGMRRVLSERRVRDWLVLLGYEVVAAQHYLYRCPWSRALAPGEGTGRCCARASLPVCPPAPTCSRRASASTRSRPSGRGCARSRRCIGGLVKPTTRSPLVSPSTSTPTGPVAAIPGPGGWAALLLLGEAQRTSCPARAAHHQQPHGAHAVIRALRGAEAPGARAHIYTDSQYVRTASPSGCALEGARLAHRRPQAGEEPGPVAAARRACAEPRGRVALGAGACGRPGQRARRRLANEAIDAMVARPRGG